jgi:hypothetical protein
MHGHDIEPELRRLDPFSPDLGGRPDRPLYVTGVGGPAWSRPRLRGVGSESAWSGAGSGPGSLPRVEQPDDVCLTIQIWTIRATRASVRQPDIRWPERELLASTPGARFQARHRNDLQPATEAATTRLHAGQASMRNASLVLASPLATSVRKRGTSRLARGALGPCCCDVCLTTFLPDADYPRKPRNARNARI